MLAKQLLRGSRLACAAAQGLLVLVITLAPHNEANALATWFGAWDYVLQHDAETQPKAAFARLRGDKGSLLWLTCQKQIVGEDQSPIRFVTAAVLQKQYLGRSDWRGRSTVYWFDGGSPEVGHWLYRDRHAQIPDPEQLDDFVDKLSKAQSLTVELSNYRYETQRLEFRLSAADTKSVADRFRKDCKDILG